MTRIDLVVLQQRLTQQQPKPATPPSWSTRPAPASALRPTPASKACPVTASAAAPAGTLRATTPMRAALPLKATNARTERAKTNALRVQIDALNAALAVANVEADRALAEERQRADRLNEQVEALSAEVVRAEAQAEATMARAERAEAGRDAERARAEALRSTIDELMAMAEIHTRELAVAQHDAHTAQQAVVELRQAEAERKGRGRLARVLAAWWGE
jgi:ribosome-binding ATPase YchF (GTP1/OBG family)